MRAGLPQVEQAVLNVEDLRIQFRVAEGTLRAVDGVSFTLEHGKTLGVVGESGSGKTVSALSILRLLETPPAEITSGRIVFDGRDVHVLIDLHAGDATATIRTNDLTTAYVHENSAYST